MPTQETPYGKVDADVLEELQQSFDTYRILYAVDAIDAIRYRICDPDQMRQDLLQLHGMAHHLFHGALPGGRIDRDCIWEWADELSMEVFEFIEKLQGVMKMLDQLARLIPNEDEEWDEEEEESN